MATPRSTRARRRVHARTVATGPRAYTGDADGDGHIGRTSRSREPDVGRYHSAVADNPRIEELRRRIQKDPASIAFAQLAEEHRRAGQFDEAVRVCRAGLAQHPAYLSARDHARPRPAGNGAVRRSGQRVRVRAQAAPDNLTAIRELADIEQRRRASGAQIAAGGALQRRQASVRPRASRSGGRRARGWLAALPTNVPLGLPGSDVLAARHARVRARSRRRGLDALIVTTPANIRYLTNHVGTAGTLVVTPSAMHLLVDFRYRESVRSLQESRGRVPGLAHL